MTREYFDCHLSATRDTWHEEHTLQELNDRAYAHLRDVDQESPDILEYAKSAFDAAANSL